jgi:hypothetical protein
VTEPPSEPLTIPWRNCKASLALVAEVNELWPDRDRASDGTIGDAAHQASTSDHNPWIVVDGVGVVRARDIDVDGIDAPWLAEYLRRRGAVGDPRLRGGGYVIYNRRITVPDFSTWKTYTGTDPHTGHIHVSFSRDPAGFDSTAAWGIYPPAAPELPTLTYGMRDSAAVANLQRFLARVFPTYAGSLPATGNYLAQTKAAVAEFQRRVGITGPGSDGSVVGPKTNAALSQFGYRA